MRISTKGEYAIEALIYLAGKEDEVINVSEVSSAINVSARYIEQIFYKLRKAGLLTTVRGMKGGYKLAREAEEISMKEIIEAAEGKILPVPCIYDTDKCTSEIPAKCPTRQMWQGMLTCMNIQLEKIKLDILVKRYNELGEFL